MVDVLTRAFTIGYLPACHPAPPTASMRRQERSVCLRAVEDRPWTCDGSVSGRDCRLDYYK